MRVPYWRVSRPRPSWHQSWHDLLFVHWPVPASALHRFVPAGLTLDEFDGTAWLGLVPFRMTGVRFAGLPAVPWLSAFVEMNLRTYVTGRDKPGVLFLRMDASRLVAAKAARAALSLPYVWSTMRVTCDGAAVEYRSHRHDARLDARYEPIGPPALAVPGSFEEFATERYCLYSSHRGRLLRVDIDHPRWELQPATWQPRVNTIAQSLGLPATPSDPHVRFARRQDVVGWGAVEVK
jgi:uncharacterized protein YqjF (DUF2071 family)